MRAATSPAVPTPHPYPDTVPPMRLALALAVLLVLAPAASASVDVRWAERQAGLHEDGTSNCSRQIDRWERAMGLKVPPCRPWCGAFVHQAALRGGTRLSARLIDPDKTYADIRAGRRGLRQIPVRDVRRGDLVLYRFRPGVRASHIEIVRGRPGADDRVPVVGGNVGHTVRLNRRGLRYVVLAARPTR
jgi:hypothetical protein